MSGILTNSLKNLPKMKILHISYNFSRMSSAWSSGLSTHQAFSLRENIDTFKSGETRKFGTVLQTMPTHVPKYSASTKETYDHLITKGIKPSVIEMYMAMLNFNQYAEYVQYDDHTYTNDDKYECRENVTVNTDKNYQEYENYNDRED